MALPNIILKSPGDLVVNNPNQMAGWQEKASLQPTKRVGREQRLLRAVSQKPILAQYMTHPNPL